MTKHHPKQQYALLLLIIDVGIQTTEIIIPAHKSIFSTASSKYSCHDILSKRMCHIYNCPKK